MTDVYGVITVALLGAYSVVKGWNLLRSFI